MAAFNLLQSSLHTIARIATFRRFCHCNVAALILIERSCANVKSCSHLSMNTHDLQTHRFELDCYLILRNFRGFLQKWSITLREATSPESNCWSTTPMPSRKPPHRGHYSGS